MKLFLIMTMAAIMTTLAGGCAQGARFPSELPSEPAPEWRKLDALVEEGIRQGVYPGAVLIVGTPDTVHLAKAYGRMTYEEDAEPMRLDSIFDMASVSKVVGTATAAWVLLEDGIISLNDPVSMYIPGFDSNGKEKVTVRDLMTHVSGLKPYENRNVVDQNRLEGETSADALIRWYAALPAAYEPRTDLRYSCLNFQTLARVTENASGRRMDDLLNERVYGPLGMKDTVYVLSDEQRARTVPTLRRGDGSLLVAEVHDPLANYHTAEEHCPGNAGLFSTGPDVARYCAMVLAEGKFEGERIFKSDTIRTVTRQHTPPAVNNMRGLGWGIYESEPWMTDLNRQSGRHVVGHTGYTGTFIWLDQNSKTYMVFLTNRVYPDDSSRPRGQLNITSVRRNLADAILRTVPEYKDYFRKKAAEGG